MTLLLIATVGAVSVINPAFASARNLADLLAACAPVIIVGCGMTLVILTGEIDISVGSQMGFLAAIMGELASPQRLGLSTGAAIALTLAAGTGAGLINGLLVTLGRIPSIIATLGTMTILRGATQLIMGGRWITELPRGLRVLGTGSVAYVPISVWVAAVIAAVAILLARRTRLGVRIHAVGDSADAARLARISPVRIRLLVFTLTGLLTAVAALVSVTQQSVIEAGIGDGFELLVITAVVVGGTSIRGGRGGIPGTILAALLLGSIRTILLFMHLGERATYWERAIQGGFILAAVLADHLTLRSRLRHIGAAA